MTGFKKVFISILMVAGICLSSLPLTALALAECGNGIFSTAWGTFKSLETLEITAPHRFLYAIIDGGPAVQQFTGIKANVRSLYGGQALSGGGPRSAHALGSDHNNQ